MVGAICVLRRLQQRQPAEHISLSASQSWRTPSHEPTTRISCKEPRRPRKAQKPPLPGSTVSEPQDLQSGRDAAEPSIEKRICSTNDTPYPTRWVVVRPLGFLPYDGQTGSIPTCLVSRITGNLDTGTDFTGKRVKRTLGGSADNPRTFPRTYGVSRQTVRPAWRTCSISCAEGLIRHFMGWGIPLFATSVRMTS